MDSIDQSNNTATSLPNGQPEQSNQFVDLAVLALIAGAQRLLDKELQEQQKSGYNSDTETCEESGDESSISHAVCEDDDELELDSHQSKRRKLSEISAPEQQHNYIYCAHSEDWTNQVAMSHYLADVVPFKPQHAQQAKRVAYSNYKLLRDQRAYVGVECLDETDPQQRAGCKRKRALHVPSRRQAF